VSKLALKPIDWPIDRLGSLTRRPIGNPRPRNVRFRLAIAGPGKIGHSSGIPALRSPAKYEASYKSRIFGTPCQMPAFRWAMLVKRSPPFSLRASASSMAALLTG
jgi:hypothetical protein